MKGKLSQQDAGKCVILLGIRSQAARCHSHFFVWGLEMEEVHESILSFVHQPSCKEHDIRRSNCKLHICQSQILHAGVTPILKCPVM